MPSPPPVPDPNMAARNESALPPTDIFEARIVSPEKVELSSHDKSAPAAPAAVPGYELLGELGRGGMGVVYKARQVKLNRLVALKMVLAGSHASSQGMARFRAEAGAIAKLQHPNIVQVYEVGEHLGLPFFSMELVTGQNLAERIATKPLSLARAVRLVEVLARAVHAAHKAGIIHRDLKPANILITKEGSPKITDFGLAKQMDASVVKTQSGAILGTPSYMAPEQAEGKTQQIGPATDVYALGAILYELITGRPPFTGPTPVATIMQVISMEPPPPSRFDPDISLDLETICLKCLHKDPSQRYAKASDLADDLRRCQADEPIQARPINGMERCGRWCHRHARIILLTVILMLSATAMGAFAIQARLANVEANSAQEALVVQAQQAEEAVNSAKEISEDAEGRAHQAEAKASRLENKARNAQKALDLEKQRADEALASLHQEKQRTREALTALDQEKQRGDKALTALDLEKQRVKEALTALDLEKQRAQEALAALERAKLAAKQPDVIDNATRKEITNSLGMRFVLVPKGTFWMGGGDGKAGDKLVAIKEDFYFGATTVTQGQWEALMGKNPSWFSRNGGGEAAVRHISVKQLAQFPVDSVSFDDAQAFLVKLNEKDKKADWVYRLPTEAEWEYACRGGATSKEDCSYSFYLSKPTNDVSSKDANFNGNLPGGHAAKGPFLERTCKVGSYAPNWLGLYDMHGNVSQWCEDKFDADGPARVTRGGGWSSFGDFCRAAFRSRVGPGGRATNLGLRLALVPSKK